MKHKTLRNAIVVVVLLIGLLCAGVMAVVAYYTAQPFSYGFYSDDETKIVQNFVVAGVDEDGVRTDLILLCQCNLSDNTLKVLQIPRDTKVENQRSDKKINSAFGTSGKTETLVDEIWGLTGIRPERFVIVSFEGFRNLIDAVGGVEMDVPIRMFYTDPEQDLVIDLYPGKQVLDGRKAEMFMRFRQNNDGTGYVEGDIGRIKAQKIFYNAVISKLLSVESVLDVPEIVSVVNRSVSTDFSIKEIVKYLERVQRFRTDEIKFYVLPGEGGYDAKGVSYFFPDKNETRVLIEENFE